MEKNTGKSKPLTLDEKIKAKCKAIQDAADERIKQVKAQVALSTKFADVCEEIKNFPDEAGRREIVTENIKALSKFGLTIQAGEQAPKTPKPQVSPDDIYSFLSANGEKATGEIESHFGVSGMTVSAKLKALSKAKKVEFRQDPTLKTRKLWKALKT